MYAQAATKPNTLLRNDAHGIVIRGVHFLHPVRVHRYGSSGVIVTLYQL